MSRKWSSAGRQTLWFFHQLCSARCSHRSGPTETAGAPLHLHTVECSGYQTHPAAQTGPSPSAGVEAAELHHTLGLGYSDLGRENKNAWLVIKDTHDTKPAYIRPHPNRNGTL